MIAIKTLAIAAWLTALTPAASDLRRETAAHRDARMMTHAVAIVRAFQVLTCSGAFAATEERPCRRRWSKGLREFAATLGTHAEHESHFSERVQNGNCERHECDPYNPRDQKTRRFLVDGSGKRIVRHAARGVYQLQRKTAEARRHWDDMSGLGQRQVNNAAYVIGSLFSRSECGGDVEKMFSAMSGRGCQVTGWGKKRAAKYRKNLLAYDRALWKLRADRGSAHK